MTELKQLHGLMITSSGIHTWCKRESLMRPSHRQSGELVQDNWAYNFNSNREDAPKANRGRT